MTRKETETWDVDLTRQKPLELSLGGHCWYGKPLTALKDLGGDTLARDCFSPGATVECGDKLSWH